MRKEEKITAGWKAGAIIRDADQLSDAETGDDVNNAGDSRDAAAAAVFTRLKSTRVIIRV